MLQAGEVAHTTFFFFGGLLLTTITPPCFVGTIIAFFKCFDIVFYGVLKVVFTGLRLF